MPLNISNYPNGLLWSLGAQNFGDTPPQAADFVQPTLEVREFLGSNLLTTVQGNGNLGVATDFPAALTIPAGELWRIRAGSFLVQAGAGAAATDAVMVVQYGGVSGNTVYLTQNADVAANRFSTRPIAFSDFWLTSGSRFGAVAGAVTLVPTYVMTLLIERYRA